MNRSEDITNTEGTPASGEYGGYSPRHVNDFPIREDSQSLPAEETAQGPYLYPDLSGGKPLDRVFSLAAVIVLLILFLIFLLGGAIAPCTLGLCGKIDRSSTSLQTSYNVQIYDFEAPFKFAWAAFAVFLFSCAVFSLYNFVLCKKEAGDDVFEQIAGYIRTAAISFLIKAIVLLAVALAGLFILVGVGYSMRAAGCLAVGAITAILLCVITVLVATTGNVRAANLEGQSRSQKITIELRTATIITVASYSFAVGGPALSYLLFRDVRALSGYLIGAVTVALLVRISGGIFCKASHIGADPTAKGPSAHGNGWNNPIVFASNAGTVVGRAVGEALQTFAAFTVAVVATSILATSLPYFGNNNYALCVMNHAEVDHTCTGFREPRTKLSFAASICRANTFYENYTSLSVWASNSSFVAVPFILGFTGVLATLISTAYRTTPGNADEEGRNYDLKQKMRPFLTRIRINVAIAAILTLVCGAAVCIGLFGNNSSFYKENSVDRDVYIIPALTRENTATRCRPLEASSDVDALFAGLPPLELTKQPYRTRDSFGEMFPKASETGWRLFLCVLLAVVLGLGLGLLHEYVVSLSRSPASRVAENGEFGASAVLVEGLGVSFVSTFGSFTVMLILVLGCYGLYGAYGIGIASLAMLSIAGPFSVISLFDILSESARGINRALAKTDDAARKTDAFETVGKRFSSVWKGLVNTGLMVGVVVLLFVVIQEADLTPSARQLGGTALTVPSRHVSDVDQASLTDIYAIASTIVGVMAPLVFCGALKLGMSRIWQRVLAVSRKRAETQRDYDRCVQLGSVGAIVETVLPGGMAILAPLIIGFGFGQRALLGMLAGLVGMSLVVSQAFCIGAGVWESGGRVVAGGQFGAEHRTGKWARAMSGGEGVGRAVGEYVGPCVVLAAAEVCGVSAGVVALMSADQTRWWIGLSLAGVFGVGGVAMIVVLNRRFDARMTELKDVVSVDRRGTSPFFEAGPSIVREHISPESELGVQRTEGTDQSELEVAGEGEDEARAVL